jgi:hypothetical protein
MDKLQTADKYVARLMMIGLFLPPALAVTAIVVSCVYFCGRVFADGKGIPKRYLLSSLLPGGIFFLYLFALPLTPPDDRHVVVVAVGNRLSLALLPPAFAILMPSFSKVIIDELRYFVYTALVVCLLANVAFVYHFYIAGHPATPITHVDYRQYLEHVTKLHPTYLSMYLAFAICILLGGFVPQRRSINIAMLYLLIILLLAMLAKSPLIALFIIFIHYGYLLRRELIRFKWQFAGITAALIAACFFIPFIGQRVHELFTSLGTKHTGTVGDNSIAMRRLIWDTDTTLLRQYWITGVGPGRLLRFLDYRYLFYAIRTNFAPGYYDPHNEYLWEWLSFGVTGIATLTAVLAAHIIRAIKTHNHLYIYLLIILCITFSTESVLSRQQGVLFYALFTSLFFFYNSGITNKSEQVPETSVR